LLIVPIRVRGAVSIILSAPYRGFILHKVQKCYIYFFLIVFAKKKGIFMAIACALAYWRPFKCYSPRPATVVYGLFWIPIYFVCAVTLPIMHHGFPDGQAIDWGFCLLGVVVLYYYVLLVPVQYITITRDSKYVLRNGLDEGTAHFRTDEPHQIEEDARYLLAREENTEELVRLLGDASVSLIRSEELTLIRRVGCGGFGEVFQASWNGTIVACKKLLAFAVNDEVEFENRS
jgi:hypothetical protein